jgi:regulator of protease activity HflC (stomatin/prohibitin superfamily)
MAGLIVAAVLILFALFVAAKTVRIIPQARAGVVERLGRYSRTLTPGLTIVVPFIDRVRPLLDLREQVVTFPPQPVITADNVSVGIDTVLYFTITEPKSATYEVANPLQAIEQLTVTTLRNIVGSLTLEQALTSRDEVNDRLRIVLDERTGKWGIRINGVELKSIDPPGTIQEAMEKQMRAERDRRAAILTAEGVKQSAILTAEGEKQSSVLKAEGAKQSAILRAEGEASAIDTVFRAIHAGDPDPKLLSYQYLQMLPQLARGDANKIWVIPSEFTQALANLGGMLPDRGQAASSPPASPPAGGSPPPSPPAGGSPPPAIGSGDGPA